MTTQLYIDKEGNVSGLADDVIDRLCSLGEKKVARVSNVEFNHTQQCWVATDLQGAVIAEHPVRSEVIAAERKYLNKSIEDAFDAAVNL